MRLLPDRPLTSLDAYLAAGGGRGLERALAMEPAVVVDEVARSGLRGRGGAGFPTGAKWRSNLELAAQYPLARVFLVANGAEGEPGTFKDRSLLSVNPFAFVEGLLIARHALGAAAIYVGVKAKFERPMAALTAALADAVGAGWPGASDVIVVPGPDEYLFGEETGLLEVIEGNLPLPRVLGPYQEGLFASDTAPNPTVVNNIETIANLPAILADGVDAFRSVGTAASPGSMLFTVIGDVTAPGVYELPLGTPLRTLLVDIAGARDIKAVYSGASNAVITPAMLDDALDFERLRADGAAIGSGGFIVYDRSRPILRVLTTLSAFLARESCGQCNACKLGTAAITELLEQLCRGQGDERTIETIWRRTATVTDANRCYLPVGEQLMVGSTLTAFADEISSGLGAPVADSDIVLPLIDELDPATGQVTLAP